MVARAQTAPPKNEKKQPQRAKDARVVAPPDFDKVPPEYNASGGWEAMPRAIARLYGEAKAKLPSGYGWMLLTLINTWQLEHYRGKNEYSAIAGKDWSDGRAHRIATAFVSVIQLARGVGCSKRTVEYVLADMVGRGIVAKRKAGKKAQYSLCADRWDKVEPKPDHVPDNVDDDDDEQQEDETPAAAPANDTRSRVSGTSRVQLPSQVVALTPAAAKRFELAYTVISGEVLIDVEPLKAKAPAATPAETPAGKPAARKTGSVGAEWRDAVAGLAAGLCAEPAGPTLISGVEAECKRAGVSAEVFSAYVHERAAAAAGKKRIAKYGAAILAHWAADLVKARAHNQAADNGAGDRAAESRYYQRLWDDASEQTRLELVAIDPDHYPPIEVV